MTGQLTIGEVLRDEGLEAVVEGSDEWERSCVDRAIEWMAEYGREFSADDIRSWLPPLRSNNLIGQRFITAARRGQIRRVGYIKSTNPTTHSHPIAVWVKA